MACKASCGEKHYRKDELEWEVYEAFIRYLWQRKSQQEYLELAQKSRVGLQEQLGAVERDLGENMNHWRVLLGKELADYPDILINEEKQKLKTEYESLVRAKAKIEAELAALPEVDPAQVDAALEELAKPWQSCGSPLSRGTWKERASIKEALETPSGDGFLGKLEKVNKIVTAFLPKKLTDEQAHLLRDTLLKLNCRITIKNHQISVSGKLPLGLGLSKVVQSLSQLCAPGAGSPTTGCSTLITLAP